MDKLQIVRHGDLSIREVLDIIEIKSTAWPFDADSQFRWMIKNLQANDLHFLLREEDNDRIIAYLNLVGLEATLGANENSVACWGLGNVCARDKKRGYGRMIMCHVNSYILNSDRIGLLLCKEPLIEFYLKMGWKLLPSQIDLGKGIFVMCFGGECQALYSIDRFF